MLIRKQNNYSEEEILDSLLEKAFCEGYSYAQKEYGLSSKLLGAFLPGGYQAKEAMKYAYDNEEDYKDVRGKHAFLGSFSPLTATIIKKKVEHMADAGKSSEEIKEWLDKNYGKRVAAGIIEILTGAAAIGSPVAGIAGLADYITDKRKHFKK